MSGGVDSSVAAALLKEQGYECIGVFMRVGAHPAAGAPPVPAGGGTDPAAVRASAPADDATAGGCATADAAAAARDAASGTRLAADDERPGPAPTDAPVPSRRLKHGCCSSDDALDARAVAGRLGIPFYALNFEADFDRIIAYFADEYARARTPNPCVQCNIHLKFGKLLRYADALDAPYVATGHYARIVTRAGQPRLARAAYAAKDQSYVLFGICRADLGRCLFPIGDLADKAAVRRLAAELGLRVHAKPDSQEICFVPDDDYTAVVRARRPDTLRPGEIRAADGRVLGRHDGIAGFTIGQRRGLGVAAGEPLYVTRLDVLTNTVTLGPRTALAALGLVAEDVNWHTDPPAVGAPLRADVKIRHMHVPAAAALQRADDGRVVVRFDAPQSAVTPGQAAVFYDGDGVVLGGGWIAAAVS